MSKAGMRGDAAPRSGIRLLVLTSTFPRWAGDHEPPFVHELNTRLADSFDIDVLAPHARGSAREETMDGIRVHRFRYAPEPLEVLAYQGGIPYRLRRYPWLIALVVPFVLAQLLTALRLLRRKRHQVVHAHWIRPQGLVGALLKRLGGRETRLLVTAHGADVYGLTHPLATALKRWVLKQADELSTVSHALAEEAAGLGCPPDRIHILPLGADLRSRFTPGEHPHPEPTLVFAGRLVPKKGLRILLEAMPGILAGRPDARLVIAGFGPERPALDHLARRLGITRHIRFTGPYRHEELPGIYRGARLAVFPFVEAPSGDREGLGLVVVEAAGCGLPVIVGDVPGVRDVVTHQETGILVAPGDARALSAAVLSLLEDEAACARLARRGRDDALRRFDWPVVRQRYADLIDAVAAAGRAHAGP
jgi:glycosyltransferase involved in cell wall biosynthesis